MERARKAPSFTRAVVILAVAAACLAGLGVVLALRHTRASSKAVRIPTAATVPTTLPYSARPGPNGTKILTEPVDLLTLAVPSDWISPAANALTLPAEIDTFAQAAPPFASVLEAEGTAAEKSAIRMFAYKPDAPHAFVSVISFSSPGIKDLTPSATAAMVAAAKRKTASVAAAGVQLPVGQVLKLDASVIVKKQPVVVESLILISGGRSMLIEMVSETNTAGIPAVFDQIAQSLRLG